MKHVKIISILIILILFTSYMLYYMGNNNTNYEPVNESSIDYNDTALELVNTLEPTILHAEKIIDNIRNIMGVGDNSPICPINNSAAVPEDFYDKINETVHRYAHEMSEAWDNENYTKYVTLLAVYKEYLGLRNTIKSSYIIVSGASKIDSYTLRDYCVINYVLDNIDNLTHRVGKYYDLRLPNNYTFAKIEEIIIDKWRNNSRQYARTYDFRENSLFAPQSTLNWALYGAWLDELNCSYLEALNITYEEARKNMTLLLYKLNDPENTMILLMLYKYLSDDLDDLKIQSTERGSMGSTWRRCINTSSQFQYMNFKEFSFIMYYAFFVNANIYDIVVTGTTDVTK